MMLGWIHPMMTALLSAAVGRLPVWLRLQESVQLPAPAEMQSQAVQ